MAKLKVPTKKLTTFPVPSVWELVNFFTWSPRVCPDSLSGSHAWGPDEARDSKGRFAGVKYACTECRWQVVVLRVDWKAHEKGYRTNRYLTRTNETSKYLF